MQLTTNGITWDIEGNPETSSYINGDHCVKGPIVLQRTVYSDGGACVSVANPKPGEKQGITDKNQNLASSYDPSLRRPDGAVVMPGESIVTYRLVDAENSTPQVLVAAVLTVVDDLPPPGETFRPAYAGPVKYGAYGSIVGRAGVQNPAPTGLGSTALRDAVSFDLNSIDEVWPDFLWEWAGRYLHPKFNMPDYGRDMATVIGSAALALCLTDGDRQQQILHRLIQIGIDNFGCYINGGAWTGMGGHGHGRLAPILIAGAALGNPSMLTVDATQFAEGNQTFFIERDEDGIINNGNGGYSAADVGIPEWAHSHGVWPNLDNPSWSDQNNPYRFCCSANSWLGQITALRVMGLLPAMNHPACPAYLDRYVRWCKANGVPGWWIYYNQPWHLQAYEELRLSESPGSDTFGYGPYQLTADTPASAGHRFRMRIAGSPFNVAKIAVTLGEPRRAPSRIPAVKSLPAGVRFQGVSYLSTIDATVMIDHPTEQTTFEVDIPSGSEGMRYVLQAFPILTDGTILHSNALQITVQPFAPEIG